MDLVDWAEKKSWAQSWLQYSICRNSYYYSDKVFTLPGLTMTIGNIDILWDDKIIREENNYIPNTNNTDIAKQNENNNSLVVTAPSVSQNIIYHNGLYVRIQLDTVHVRELNPRHPVQQLIGLPLRQP